MQDAGREKIKVLHLRATNFYGGPERQIHRHALAARSTSYEIIVGSFSESGRPPALLDRASEDGIRVHCFDVKSAYDRRSARLVREYLKSEKIEILATHDYRTNILGRLIVRDTNTRWVAFSRGWTRENFRIRLYHALDKVCLRFADHIVAVACGQRDKLRRLAIPSRKISVVHNAILPSSFEATEPVDLKARLGLPSDALIGVAGGRFSNEKGQAYLIEAARSAIRKNDRLHFILFGDGLDLDMMRRKVDEAGISDHVLCPGFEANLACCLKSADILINPSLSEGLPNIVLEAMALGVPVVATAVGGVPELVTHDESGLLVAPRDSAGLADAILGLAGDPTKRAALAQRGLEVVTRSFSFDRQCKELVEVYNTVLRRGGAAWSRSPT